MLSASLAGLIRLDWPGKNEPGTNGLAYFELPSVATKKRVFKIDGWKAFYAETKTDAALVPAELSQNFLSSS